MSRRKKILLGALVIVLLIPAATLYFVATTESGLQFVVNRLQGRRIGPATITAQGATGTLVDGFKLQRLRIEQRRADVDLAGIEARLALAPLFVPRISLPFVRIKSASIVVKEITATGGKPWQPRFLASALRADIESITIAKGSLTAINGTRYDFTALVGAGVVYPKEIRIASTTFDWQDSHIEAKGRVLAAIPFGVEGDLNITYHPLNLPVWKITANLGGDLDELPIKAAISEPFHAQIEGAAYSLSRGWNYRGRAAIADFDITRYGGGKALGLISGSLDLTANGDGFTAKGPLTPADLKAGPIAVDFAGKYALHHLDIRDATFRHAPSGSTVTLRGGLNVVTGGPDLDLSGSWQDFQWPLPAKIPASRSPRGTFTLRGIKPWRVEAQGDVSTPDWPLMAATLNGQLAAEHLIVDAATANILGGTADFTGDVQWTPNEQWRIAGLARGINPVGLRADLPGRLNFAFTAAGAPFGDNPAIALDIDKLSGQLRRAPASGRGHFSQTLGSDDWQFEKVDLRFGRTHIQLDGGLGGNRDLRFAIDADDLSLIDADARGRISARGRYAGTNAQPILLFKARGSNFEWGENALQTLDADVDIDLSSGGHTQGQINFSNLQYSGRTFEKASVQLGGAADAQRIVVGLTADPLRMALTAQGVYSEGLWRGQIRTLGIDDNRNLKLTLESATSLQFNRQQIKFENLCLKGGEERVCLTADQSSDHWEAAFSAAKLPLRALTAGVTQEFEYEGTIGLEGDARGGKDVPTTGKVDAKLTDARLRHRLVNGRDERLSLGSGTVEANATTDGFSLQVGLDAGTAGNLKGELTGQRSEQVWQSYPIKGSLSLSTTGLSLLDLYVGGIDRATGRLNTTVEVAGTLGSPQIKGLLQLRDAQIDIYQVNLSLRDLSLDARFDANVLDLEGRSRVGEGSAKVNGRLAWRDREPFGELHVEGENLRVVDVPEARIDASPKLDFKLAGRRIEAKGEVRLPYARLEPADLTNAVLASSDEVLVGAPPVDPTQRWTVVSDIRLILGDRVNIDTFGLTARLGGNIAVRTDESQLSRGQGELNIVEGKYAALGRKLDIARGRLIFANVPVGDPGIDLRAQKVFPDVTAGVNVRGSLRSPRTSFFSEPAIPQSQIVSLILAGGSLESVQNSTRAGAARNDLLVQGGAILAQQLGSKVGVEDISIESDLSNETSLVLGKYLSPRLYVSYGISLAEAINTLKLRYTIGDRWTLKTESGKARSADVVYTIQK